MIRIKFDQTIKKTLKTKFWIFEVFRLFKKPFKNLVFSKPFPALLPDQDWKQGFETKT